MLKPLAIITTLEDSPPGVDQRLLSAYIKTRYHVPELGLDLRVGECLPAFDGWLDTSGFEHYAFLTAWNPGSTQVAPAWNKVKNAELRGLLKRQSALVLPGLGVPEEGSDWPPEESWLALDLKAEHAVSLARTFGQNALVYGRKGGLAELWWIA